MRSFNSRKVKEKSKDHYIKYHNNQLNEPKTASQI